MPQEPLVVHSDPKVMSGTLVFVGTRVPFQTLLDYLESGQPLSEFLEDFPTVRGNELSLRSSKPRKRSSLVHVLLDQCLPRLKRERPLIQRDIPRVA